MLFRRLFDATRRFSTAHVTARDCRDNDSRWLINNSDKQAACARNIACLLTASVYSVRAVQTLSEAVGRCVIHLADTAVTCKPHQAAAECLLNRVHNINKRLPERPR